MRRHTIARLTVDRPHLWAGERAVLTAEWLEAKAEEIESELNCYSLSGYTARRTVAGALGAALVTVGKLHISAAGALSLSTRKRIAKWLRSRAAYLRAHWAVCYTSRRGWFVQEYQL